MPAYSRDGGAWEQSVMRQRSSGEWSADDALGFVRDGGAWVQFQAPAGDTDLLQPINLVATPDDLEATFTWDNPTPLSEAATPTHIQFRIPETTAVWTEYVYPVTTTTISYLAAATDYQFQIRYITRVDGVIDLVGPITEVFFTTLALTGPGIPAEDPGGTGGDSTTYWGPLPGGGTVGGGGCWYEYIVQEFDVDTYTWSDTATTGSVAGTGAFDDLDFITLGFDCGATLRFKWRQVCNSVPGAYTEELAFTVMCDYTDPCGGVNQTNNFSSAPWTDAVLAMPKICYENARTIIEDFYAAGVEYGRLAGFNLPMYREGAWELVAKNSLSLYGEPLVSGHVPDLVPLGSAVPSLTSDMSVTMQLRLAEQPTAPSGAPVKLLEIGKVVRLYAYAEGAGVRFSASVSKTGGGSFNLAGTTEVALNDWVTVVVTIDQDGNKLLYVDADVDATDADTTRANFSLVKGDVEVYGNDLMRVRKVGVWDRVLSLSEIQLLGGYDGILISMAPSFFAKLDETTLENPPIWLTYTEAIADQPYLDGITSAAKETGLGAKWVIAWTDEYTGMEWPTFGQAGTDNAYVYLGPYWFDAFYAQATPVTYDNMVVNEIGAMFFTALDELDAATNTDPVGGTITEAGGYRYHTFLASESFYTGVVTGSLSVDYILVGGGGGGASGNAANNVGGGGGGGGAVIGAAVSLTDDAYPFVLGTGGAGGTGTRASNGNDSTFNSQTANGGGGGGHTSVSSGAGGNASGNGSGGGGGSDSTPTTGAGGTSGTGYAGGTGAWGGTQTEQRGGGGGSPAAAGGGGTGATGAAGVEWPSGSGTRYGGGGSPGWTYNFSFIGGGAGGGGLGRGTNGSAGTANTGGGGGGSELGTGGAGGSGILIVRYAI